MSDFDHLAESAVKSALDTVAREYSEDTLVELYKNLEKSAQTDRVVYEIREAVKRIIDEKSESLTGG